MKGEGSLRPVLKGRHSVCKDGKKSGGSWWAVVKLREILPVNQMWLDMSCVSFSTKLQDKLNVPDEQEVGMPVSFWNEEELPAHITVKLK